MYESILYVQKLAKNLAGSRQYKSDLISEFQEKARHIQALEEARVKTIKKNDERTNTFRM